MPIEHATMLQSDLCLSDNKWDLLRKWFPDIMPPSKHIVDLCKNTDPVIVPIFDARGLLVAHRVNNIIDDFDSSRNSPLTGRRFHGSRRHRLQGRQKAPCVL